MKKYGVPVVVAINRFQCDTDAELHFIQEFCESLGAEFALTEVFAKAEQAARNWQKRSANDRNQAVQLPRIV